MGFRVPNGDTTISSTTGWDQITNTPTLHATTSITVSTAARFTATFTAPNTTDSCKGALFYMADNTFTTINITLQEDLGGTGTWVDTASTVSLDPSIIPNSTWFYAQFASTYTFATTGANRYRYKINCVSGSGTLAADSGGTLYSFLSVDSRTGALGTDDSLFILAPNLTGTVTVTVDGTSGSCGNGGDGSILASQRSLNNAIIMFGGGILQWDTAASATLKCAGHVFVCSGAGMYMGTTGSPYPSGKLARIQFSPTVDGDFGIRVLNGGKLQMQGTPKSSTTLWKTTYSSGTGTALDPLITATAVDWDVNDEIIVCATGTSATNYQETENKFIKTKNSATSYVLSDTKGGAASALTYTHTTDAYILNVERNVLMDTDNTSKACYLYNASLIPGDVAIKWTRFETVGNSAVTTKVGIQPIATTGVVASCDYSVAYRPRYRGFYFVTSKIPGTFTGLIACNGAQLSNSVGAFSVNSLANKTFNDCFAVNNNRLGIQSSAVNGVTYNRCVAISNNTVGTVITTAGTSGWYVTTGVNTYNDCESHCNRVSGLWMNSALGSTWNRYLSGTKGENQVDIYTLTDTLNQALFDDSVFNSTTFINNYQLELDASEIRFHRYQQTDNNHRWYNNYGSAQSTGAGLSDTTVRTPGSLGVRMNPEDATTPFTWEFNIPAKAHSVVNFFGYFGANATWVADVAAVFTVELFLPGSSSADATSMPTLPDVVTTPGTSWLAIVLSAQNTADTDGLATVRISSTSGTAGAYTYADDFYNAGDTITSSDKVTGLDTWSEGKPLVIITPQATSAADIWTFPTANLTTAGTTGNHLAKKVSTKAVPKY